MWNTVFDIDTQLFDITNYDTGSRSIIHFGTWNTWTSLEWVIFWWWTVAKDMELHMNWSSIYCKKQLKWFYINQARWNVAWPLDTTTMWLFKWNFLWYQNLSMSGWLFTHCTWDLITDYNGIFGYINHTLADGRVHQLRAWFKYTDHMYDIRWDSLWQEYDLINKKSYIKWVLFDSYGGLGFIETWFNIPMIMRNVIWDALYFDITMTPSSTSIDWELDFDLDFWTNRDIFLDNVKVYVDIPSNVDIDWDSIWIMSGNTLLIFDDKLYPLQSRHFSFKWTATAPWAIVVTWRLDVWWTRASDIATWYVLDTKINLSQKVRPDRTLIVDHRLRYTVTISNKGDMTWYNVKFYDILPDHFVYTGDYTVQNQKILLFSWNLKPREKIDFEIDWYFEKVWTFTNTLKATSDNFGPATNELDINVDTHICGNWNIEEDYEYCDDGSKNGKRWYCNSTCTDITNHWVACKYTDVNYLSNWPFIDTLNHRWAQYIEIMRTSCLHRWKWTFAWQWKYDPDEYVTKAEVLKTLVKIRWIAKDDFNIQNEDAPYNGVQIFEDVPGSHRFSRYSFYAYDNHIADGLYTIKNGKRYLDPDGPITRNEMIKAVMNLYKEIVDSKDIKITWKSSMTDVHDLQLYYQYVREAEKLWIISWYDMPDGTKTWQWNNYLTRAQFAKIVSIPFEDILFD